MLKDCEIRLICVLADWIERGRLLLKDAKLILMKEVEPARAKKVWRTLLLKVKYQTELQYT